MSKELMIGHINAALKDGRITLEEIQTITSTEDGWFSDPVSTGDHMDSDEHGLLVDLLGDLLQGKMNNLNKHGEIKCKKDRGFTVDKEAEEYLDNFMNGTYSQTWADIKTGFLDIALIAGGSAVGAVGGASVGAKAAGWSFTKQWQRLLPALKYVRYVEDGWRYEGPATRLAARKAWEAAVYKLGGIVETRGKKVYIGMTTGGASGCAVGSGNSWLFGKYDD